MPRVVLGKSSGLDSIRTHLNRIRAKATDEQVNDILLRVKAAWLRKMGLLGDKEFRKIVKQVAR